MPFVDRATLESIGFRELGNNVLVSDRAAIYNPEQVSLADNVRIDDFCVLAGRIAIGRNVHVTVYCNLAGGRSGISIGNYSTLAYGCHVIAQSDDYSGESMTNSTVSAHFKKERSERVEIGDHVILGAGTMVLEGVRLADGTAAGARTLFLESSEPWTMYVGQPARILRPRSRKLLDLVEDFERERRGE